MMKNLLLIIMMSIFSLWTFGQNIWTNEFHYDNVGTDENEFIEVVLENAGSYTLSDFAITLYNGNSGESYNTKTLDQYTEGTTSEGFTLFYFDYPENGIQNGENDGIAISYQDALIDGQFISYEGTLTAVDGPASGHTSVDIGVSEVGVASDQSLQLAGTGGQYSDFMWQEPALNTKGDLNNGQTFGTFVPDPEPSNYPTDFSASPVAINVIIEWTDAVGEQLPFAYVVLGTTGDNFTPPVDGVPVNDDTDFSDGEVALNVAFGEGSCYFNVDPNTEYLFTIYPYTNTGSDIDYKTDGTAPTASTTSNNFSIANLEGFDSDLGTWTGYDVNGEQIWGWTNNGVPPGCAIMNGYYDGEQFANEDWLISPSLDLSNYEEIMFSFDHSRNYGTNDGLSVLVSTDYDGSSDPSTNGTWSDLSSLFTFPEDGPFIPAGEADVSTFNESNTYFAFRYVSTTEDCSKWEVDNALIYGVLGVGIDDVEDEQISIYPNPANELINITSSSQGSIRIINLAGQVVLQARTEKGINRINVEELNPGLYMVQYVNESGNTSTQKLLIR